MTWHAYGFMIIFLSYAGCEFKLESVQKNWCIFLEETIDSAFHIETAVAKSSQQWKKE